MKQRPFSVEQFTATEWDSAEGKARWANAMAAWVERGFPERGFTNILYQQLHLHMYSHIAHYDKQGFYRNWFCDNYQRLKWLRYTIEGGACGYATDAAWTWSDVEKAFSQWVRSVGLIEQYEKLCAEETEARERALLVQLQTKYGS